MTPRLCLIIRAFNAWCFAVFVLGILLLLRFAANAVDDSLAGFRPGMMMSWVLLFMPISPMELVLPALGVLAHWRSSANETVTYLALLWHLFAALLGGIAMFGSSLLYWNFATLNGDPPITIGQVIANLLLLTLFLIPLIWGPRLKSVRTDLNEPL